MSDPEAPRFVWVSCPNAREGEVHFPCQTCTWKLKEPTNATT